MPLVISDWRCSLKNVYVQFPTASDSLLLTIISVQKRSSRLAILIADARCSLQQEQADGSLRQDAALQKQRQNHKEGLINATRQGCNEIAKFSPVQTTPSVSGQAPGYRSTYSRQHPPEAARWLPKRRRCLQLPPQDTAPGLAWGSIRLSAGLEGLPAERTALDVGPEGWTHHL